MKTFRMKAIEKATALNLDQDLIDYLEICSYSAVKQWYFSLKRY